MDNKKCRQFQFIFPDIENKQLLKKLKIDSESYNYISVKNDAKLITTMILEKINDMNIPNIDLKITDATGGVGGNTLSFGRVFSIVYSVEIDPIRAEYLQNNVNVYNLKNVIVLNSDYTKLDIVQDILFVDPPWGGTSYKEHQNLKLTLGNTPIEDICNIALNKKTKLIALKLPYNYDINYLMKNIISRKITTTRIKNMIIVLIEGI